MNTNKHESVKNMFPISRVQKVVVSILEHTTQQRAIERKTKNQSMLKDNLSCVKNIHVHWCSSVVKNGGLS